MSFAVFGNIFRCISVLLGIENQFTKHLKSVTQSKNQVHQVQRARYRIGLIEIAQFSKKIFFHRDVVIPHLKITDSILICIIRDGKIPFRYHSYVWIYSQTFM